MVQTARHLLEYLHSRWGLKHILFTAGEEITVQFPLKEYAIHAPKLLGDLNQHEVFVDDSRICFMAPLLLLNRTVLQA